VRTFRIVVTAAAALTGAFLAGTTAREQHWGAPTTDLPENLTDGSFTAITLELPGAPIWILAGAALLGAIAFGSLGWLVTGASWPGGAGGSR
jgi:hypothetical protein